MLKTKIISIITAVTLLSVGFWISAEPWGHSATKFRDSSLWIFPARILVILSASIAVAYMLLPQKRLKLLLALLIGGTYLVIFGRDYLQILVLFIIPLFHVFAIREIQLESTERLNIHPGFIIKRGIALIMIPLYIALSFAYFQSPSIQTATRDQKLSPTFKQIAGDVLDRFLESQNEVSEQDKQFAKNYAIEQAYDTIMSYFEPFRPYFPPIFAFGLFLVLLGLGFIFHRVSSWVGMILFWLLRKTQFVKIVEVDTKAQSIAI